MKPTRFDAIGMVVAAALALAGCQQKAPEEGSASGAPSGAPTESPMGPDAKPGIAVTGGVLVLPAVKGRPGAAYFAIANGGSAPTTLAAIQIEGSSKAEMHETKGGAMEALGGVEIKPGESLGFERGGKHVMVFDIADTVKAGGTAEMTLTFAGGDKISVPLRVETVGGGAPRTGGSMDGMGHGEHD